MKTITSKSPFFIVCIIFIALTSLFAQEASLAEEKEAKNVLVVNSYHPGYEWSDDIVKGIQSVFGDNNFNIFVEYLDSKRYSDDIYYKYLEEIIRYKYSDAKIDAIIVSDHHAFYLMLRMRKTFQADVPLIFCGIDRVDPEGLTDYKPIYGIEEGDSGIRSTLDLILSIHPGIRKIFFVADQTTSAGVMLTYVRDYEPSYKEIVTFDYLINMSTGELKAALKNVPQDSVVMWLHFIKDKNGKVFSVSESQTYVANNASVPVYVCYGFSADTGIVGGSIIQGFTQGEKAAQIALELLSKNIVPAPFFQRSPFTNMFDYKVMKRFNIGIKDIPENSVIYNKPFSVFEKYRWQIIGIILFMVFQTLLIVILMINLKKRKAGEKSLSESEERFRATFEQAAVGISHVSPDGRFLRINKKFCDIVGYSREEMTTKTFQDITHPDDLDTDVKQKKQLLSGEIDTYSMEKRYVCKNGELVWVHLTNSLVRNEAGQPQWFVAVVKDITERKQMEERLHESEEQFRDLMEQSSMAIQIMNPDGRIIQVNDAYMNLWDISEETYKIIRKNYSLLKDEEAKRLGIMPLIKRAFGGESVILPPIEYNAPDTLKAIDVKQETGRKRWIQTRLYPVKNEEGVILNVVLMSEDITERTQAEEDMNQLRNELLHATRTGTMVELTAALAHEINHPLGSILNNANAAKRFLDSKKPDLDEIREIIADIISEDRRASDVIQKLRSLMKKTEAEFIPLDINHIIEEVLVLTHSELVIKNISLSKKLKKNLPNISGERVQLQQVFLNLIMNANDAMKKSRTKNLHISTATDDAKNIIVCVRDSGTGLDESNKDKLFEPFYTTKKEGMGMGLSVNKTIITAHNGDIWAENNKEGGASFYIKLPII